LPQNYNKMDNLSNKLCTKEEKMAAFGRLLDIMDELREKCPWDKKQRFDTLRILTIEETYELADAITQEDFQSIGEEIGDLLLHIVFYARLGQEIGAFDIGLVIHNLCEKLIRRHPHIYGDVVVHNEEDVMKNWEKIKLREKGKESALQGVPRALPALPKSLRIQEKAKKVGFEWDTRDQVWAKVLEELAELHTEVDGDNRELIEKEFGDVLFALTNYARFIEVDPEGALEKTNQKFISRFQKMESIIKSRNQNMIDMTLTEMDAVWEEVKQIEKAKA